MVRRASVLLMLVLGCGSSVQRAAVTPPPATSPAAPAPPPVDVGVLRPAARRYQVDPSRSRFEVFAADVLTGEHKMTFGEWRGEVTVGDAMGIDVSVDMDSVAVDLPRATPFVKEKLLEVQRYPTATLTGTLEKVAGGAPDEYVVSGVAEMHGVKKGLRFVGRVSPDGDGYRFATDFVVSRKEFRIRYGPVELFLRDDVRLVVDVYASPAVSEP